VIGNRLSTVVLKTCLAEKEHGTSAKLGMETAFCLFRFAVEARLASFAEADRR